jgi:hypothetical protein
MTVGIFEGISDVVSSGKGQLRFLIQPLVAIVLGARLGVADAREGRLPFVWRLFMKKGRMELFKASLSDVLLPLCVGIVIDAILQHIVLDHIRPLQAVIVGLLVVWLPYSIARGLANRFARHKHEQQPAQ